MLKLLVATDYPTEGQMKASGKNWWDVGIEYREDLGKKTRRWKRHFQEAFGKGSI